MFKVNLENGNYSFFLSRSPLIPSLRRVGRCNGAALTDIPHAPLKGGFVNFTDLTD